MEMVIVWIGISVLMTVDVLGVVSCIICWNDDDWIMFIFILFWTIVLFNGIIVCVFKYLRELFLL